MNILIALVLLSSLQFFLVLFFSFQKWKFWYLAIHTYIYCRSAFRVINRAFNHKVDYFAQVQEILNPEGFQNCIIGSKVTAILLDRWILPMGAVAFGMVCKLRDYLVQVYLTLDLGHGKSNAITWLQLVLAFLRNMSLLSS